MRSWFLVKNRILPALLFVVYVFLLLYLTVIKRLFFGTTSGVFLESYRLNTSGFDYSVNLIPFKTVYGYLVHPPSITVAITNILGNILAFLPLGILVPLIFRKSDSISWIFIISVGSSVVIETVQLLFRIGSMDIDDVLLNSVGGLVGFLLYRGFLVLLARYKSEKDLAKKLL